MEKPLVDKKFLLQKFPGKGGWTYAEIPEIKPDKKAYFNWVKVRGTIDDFEIKQYNLQPMGNGKLFLPVKTAIRKKIKKEAGDWVHVKLYLDNSKLEIPEEIMECFEFEPKETLETFMGFTESERKYYLNWINEAHKEETKIERIATMMKRLSNGLKMYD